MHQSAASTVGSPAIPQSGPAHHKGKAPDHHDPFGKSLPIRMPGLDQVLNRKNIAIYSNTIDFQTIRLANFGGSFITPMTIFESSTIKEEASYHLWVAARASVNDNVRQRQDKASLTRATQERFLVEFGKTILDQVDGPHYTFIDPVLSDNHASMIEASTRLIVQFEEQGVTRDRIVISIPATDAGILAAKEVAKAGILVNLDLVTSLEHAAACAEVGPYSITIPVCHILDWFDEDRKRNPVQEGDVHHLLAGYHTIQSISTYFRTHQIKTRLIATEFRNLSDIALLNDFDAICLPKDQIEALPKTRVRLLPNPDFSAGRFEYPTNYTLKPKFSEELSERSQQMLHDIHANCLDQLFDAMQSFHEIANEDVEDHCWLMTPLEKDLPTLWDTQRPTATHGIDIQKQHPQVQSLMTTRGKANPTPIKPQVTYDISTSDFSNHLSETEIDGFLLRCRQHVTKSPRGTLNGQGTGSQPQD